MTSLVTEHFDKPASPRHARALNIAGERASELLAGRTVWCVMSMGNDCPPAEELRARLDGADTGATAATLRVGADEQVLRLAERVDEMIAASAPASWPSLGAAEVEACARAAMGADELIGEAVELDDVVVVHDTLGAIALPAVRERGAHAVWRLRVARTSGPAALRALDFLQRFTPGIDAYVLSWLDRGPHGEVVESVGAAMPSAGLLAAKEFPTRFTGEQPRRLAWTMALAEIVRSDRGECVGGTLHPCPTVPAR